MPAHSRDLGSALAALRTCCARAYAFRARSSRASHLALRARRSTLDAHPSAWFASCIDDRPPDYEPNAVFRISVDETPGDVQVFLRMLHIGAPSIVSMRVTLPQILYSMPVLMHRFGADRTLWRLLPTYLPPASKYYGLDGLYGSALREGIWAVLLLAHQCRESRIWASMVGTVGGRPPDMEWVMLRDPYTVARAEITPEREVLYRILLSAARVRGRMGVVDFEYTDKHLMVWSKKSPEVRVYFDL